METNNEELFNVEIEARKCDGTLTDFERTWAAFNKMMDEYDEYVKKELEKDGRDI